MNSKVHQGHRARKRFGQNFLHDQNVIASIVAAINPKKDQTLVEIGPGLGALTEPVAELVDQLNVVELDKDLAERLQSHPFIRHKLTIHQADAMRFDFSQLIEDEKPLRVFGNLPYNISTPLMFHLFTFSNKVKDMHFMLQKEVVNRLAAGPNCKAYGRLSVMAQYYCAITPILEVPPGAFKPAPKVDSAVVRLEPYAELPVVAKDVKLLNKVCTMAFNQRRKTLRNSLKKLFTEPQLEELGIDPNNRPENVTVAQYVALANWLYDNPIEEALDDLDDSIANLDEE